MVPLTPYGLCERPVGAWLLSHFSSGLFWQALSLYCHQEGEFPMKRLFVLALLTLCGLFGVLGMLQPARAAGTLAPAARASDGVPVDGRAGGANGSIHAPFGGPCPPCFTPTPCDPV